MTDVIYHLKNPLFRCFSNSILSPSYLKKYNNFWEMQDNKIEERIKQLELEELEAENSPSTDVYIQLFAAYLLKNDLSSARYLWKRIPKNVKTGNKELERLHTVYIGMWNNKSSEIFKTLKFNWSPSIQPTINSLEEKIREEVLDLIGRAYTSIFENVFIEMTNLSSDKVKETCDALGWEIEESSSPRLILPAKNLSKKSTCTSSKDQLSILTDFVSFLEN